MSRENPVERTAIPHRASDSPSLWSRLGTFLFGALVLGVGVILGSYLRGRDSSAAAPPADGAPYIAAWANCDVGVASSNKLTSLQGSFNIKSAERVANGRVHFEFEKPMPSDHYAILASSGMAHITIDRHDSKSFDLTHTTAAGATQNDGQMHVVVIANR